MIDRAFRFVNRNLSLVTIPVLLDLAALLLGLATTGFWGEAQLTFKFIVDVGVPSISNILQQNVLAGGSVALGGEIDGAAFFLLLAFFLVGAFVQGGFIGLLKEGAAAEPPTPGKFFGYGQKFWGRFLIMRLLVAGVLFLGLMAAMLLSIVGLLAFTVAYIVLRIKFIYWEFTVVAEDLRVIEAFNRSKELFKQRPPELNGVLLAILGVNFLAGLLLNALWHPVMLFLGVFVYAYLGTILQLALMNTRPGSDGNFFR